MSIPNAAARAGLIALFEQYADRGEMFRMEIPPDTAAVLAETLRAVVDPQIAMSVEPDELEKAIVSAAKSHRNVPFSANDIMDLSIRLESLRGQLVQARAKEALVSAQLGSCFHRAIIEIGGHWDVISMLIDDDPKEWDELVARARFSLSLPSVDENEIQTDAAGETDGITFDSPASGVYGTEESGITREQAQQRIAEMLGVDPSQVTVHEIEGDFDLSALDHLVGLLGVPAGRLAAGEKTGLDVREEVTRFLRRIA